MAGTLKLIASAEVPITTPQNNKNAATQTVPSEIVGANGRTELQWPQCHKKQARHNMNESEDRKVGKHIIQRGEPCSRRMGCDSGWMIASDHDGYQMCHPPHCHG